MKFGETPVAVYTEPNYPTTIEELKEKIQQVMENLESQPIRDAFQNMRRRAFACLEQNGGHFNENRLPHF